ncbi:MAG: DUF3530 family protein, partial [Proteobacteria bacterium]|nr:DUF3530 family protein [Pseudomonadota bacterium]
MSKIVNSLILFSLLLLATPSSAVTVNLDSTGEGGGGAFSGELLESSCAKIGVVMYHGRGSTPTGPVVEELRTSLFRAGYTTLSIENPLPASGVPNFSDYVTDVDAVFIETYARMRTAINLLHSRGVEQVVLAGFSLGSRFSTAHVARGQLDELTILGLIGIGMYGDSVDPLNVSDTLKEVTIPVLDIYGDADTSAASSAAARLAAYAGADYTQTKLFCLAGLNCHQLEGLKGNDSMPLEITVNAWMQAIAPAAVLPNCGTQPPPATAPPQTIPDAGGSTLDLYLLLLLPVLLSVFRR